MKRQRKSITSATNRYYRDTRWNYATLDAVLDDLDAVIDSIKDRKGINIALSSDTDREEFVIECEVDTTPEVVTPEGYRVSIEATMGNYNNIASLGYYLLDEVTMPSEYGDITLPSGYELPNSAINYYGFVLAKMWVSNSPYEEMTLRGDDGKAMSVSDVSSLITSRINKLLTKIDESIHKSIKYEEDKLRYEAERAKLLQDKRYARPVTMSIAKQAIKEFRSFANGQVRVKGDVLRYISYEDDYTIYISISDAIQEMNNEGVVSGELLDEPGTILEYGELASYGISMASETSDYLEFQREKNAEYGFSRR